MIIEATFTYSPGNYNLLHYLLCELEIRRIKAIVYLGHKVVYENLEKENFSNITLVFSSNLSTIFRFLKKRNNVLFFCSLPPFVKQGKSIVYFHSSYIARAVEWNDDTLALKTKLKRWLSTKLIRYFHTKVDFFACQTPTMSNELKKYYKSISLKLIPFFDVSQMNKNSYKNEKSMKYDFFYPSTPDVHKNHFRFLEAIEKIAAEREIKVCVTIPNYAKRYINKINSVNTVIGKNVIENIGRVPKSKVIDIFHYSKAMFFPSLEESFGLPILEAAWIGCPVLISNLPYAFDIIDNPVTFDPYSVSDMINTMNHFLEKRESLQPQNLIIENKLDILISYFINK